MNQKKIIESKIEPEKSNLWFDLNENKLKKWGSNGWEIISGEGGDIPSNVYTKPEIDSLLNTKTDTSETTKLQQNLYNTTLDINTKIKDEHSWNYAEHEELDNNRKQDKTEFNNRLSEISNTHTQDIKSLNNYVEETSQSLLTYINSKLTGAMHYRGVVNSLDDIDLSDRHLGDFWTVKNENNSEYVYTENNEFENIGTIQDLSELDSKITSLKEVINIVRINSENKDNELESKISSISDITTEDCVKIDGDQHIIGKKIFDSLVAKNWICLKTTEDDTEDSYPTIYAGTLSDTDNGLYFYVPKNKDFPTYYGYSISSTFRKEYEKVKVGNGDLLKHYFDYRNSGGFDSEIITEDYMMGMNFNFVGGVFKARCKTSANYRIDTFPASCLITSDCERIYLNAPTLNTIYPSDLDKYEALCTAIIFNCSRRTTMLHVKNTEDSDYSITANINPNEYVICYYDFNEHLWHGKTHIFNALF